MKRKRWRRESAREEKNDMTRPEESTTKGTTERFGQRQRLHLRENPEGKKGRKAHLERGRLPGGGRIRGERKGVDPAQGRGHQLPGRSFLLCAAQLVHPEAMDGVTRPERRAADRARGLEEGLEEGGFRGGGRRRRRKNRGLEEGGKIGGG